MKGPLFCCQHCHCNVEIQQNATCSCGKEPYTGREVHLLGLLEEIMRGRIEWIVQEMNVRFVRLHYGPGDSFEIRENQEP